MWLAVAVFMAGLVEDFFEAAYIDAVSKYKKWLATFYDGILCFIELFGYFILYTIITDLDKWPLIIIYFVGNLLGTWLCVHWAEKRANAKSAGITLSGSSTFSKGFGIRRKLDK